MGKMGHKKSFTLGAVLGGLCGGMTALLFAPKKGKDLRKDLCKTCDATTEKARELMETAKEESEALIEKACCIVCEAKEKAQEMINGNGKRRRR